MMGATAILYSLYEALADTVSSFIDNIDLCQKCLSALYSIGLR